MSKYQVTKELRGEILSLHNGGAEAHKIKKEIMKITGCKKTRAAEIYHEVIGEVEDDIFDFELESEAPANKPYFNKMTNKYVVFVKPLGRNIVVSEARHKQILEMYSDWDGEPRTLNEICRSINWPRPVLMAYLKSFNIGHDSLPVTEEELAEHDDEELLSRLRELRKFNLYQKLEKEGWDGIKADALKWRRFEYKKFNPFAEAIEKWSPPENKNTYIPPIKISRETMLVVLSDIHLGMWVPSDTTFRDSETNSDLIYDRLMVLAGRIVQDAKDLNISNIKILFLGDIINSANTQGTTNKGTILENDAKGGQLVEFALSTLASFLQTMLDASLRVSCVGMTGNHDGALGEALLLAIKSYFRKEIPNFEVTYKFIDKMRINNSLVLFSHGSHHTIKAKVPSGNKTKGYAQSLFLDAQKTYPECTSRYLFCADLHHFQSLETNDYEYFLVPSIAGSSNFSDALNLHSRPRQNAFIFDNQGIKMIRNYYFD